MHRQVSQPRQDPTEDPSEPICEDTDLELTSRVEGSSKAALVAADAECMEPLIRAQVPDDFSHSTETAADVDVGEGSPSRVEDRDSGDSASVSENEDSSPERPPECRKAIQKMGLQKGSLRAMIASNLLPKENDPKKPIRILPDEEETCKSPDEEIMVMCTPAMIDIFKARNADKTALEQMEKLGAPLSQILKTLKTCDSDVADKLTGELAITKIQTRRRKVRNIDEGGSVDSMTLKRIRQSYAERQYQRMLEKDVGGCVNALKNRTEDKWCDQKLMEMRMSYSTGLSAIIVFVVSFLVGYYFALYCVGVKSIGAQILFGSITAVFGGLLEAILLTIAYGRIDAKVK